METLLLINADEPEEVRVAVVEDGRLEEIYIEAGADPVGKGNVYVGRVLNVERGIGAAFVDLGGGVTGFLHESDIRLESDVRSEPDSRPEAHAPPEPPVGEEPRPATIAPEPDVDPVEPADSPEPEVFGPEANGLATTAEAQEVAAAPPAGRASRRIQDLVSSGDEVLVQVSRGPMGQKGPALTTRISLPGRYLVLLAHATRGGVSRRIESAEERDRARALLEGLSVPAGMGVILRTAAAGRTKEEVAADLAALLALWEGIRARLASGKGPRAVHLETDLALRAVRDLLPPSTTRIVVDDAATAQRVREYLARLAPPLDPEGAVRMPSVEVHPAAEARDPQPLFHAHGVEGQVEDAFRRTVRLPSGGSLVIDPTEALVAIDVNSGRLTGEEDLEATAFKTDLEAVPEVARQLRLRDLGGVIVVDFIDLEDLDHIREVEQALKEALKRDRARIRLGRMGPFGCLELTRQRIRPALSSVTHVGCPSCGGTGRRRHPVGLALRILREVRSRAARSRGQGGIEARVPPAVADVLRTRKARSLKAVEARMTGPVRVVPDPSIPYGSWSLRGLPARGAVGAPAGKASGAGFPPAPPATPGPESA